uniref:USH1C n=1 Tax=Poeciliopsis prolifica TaxID=188132 RepID=A0A0S7ESR2_9TELE
MSNYCFLRFSCVGVCLCYLVGSGCVLFSFFTFCATHLVMPQKGEKKKKRKKMSNTDTLQEQRKNKKEMEFELKLAREKEEMQEREKQLKINRLVQEVRKDVV